MTPTASTSLSQLSAAAICCVGMVLPVMAAPPLHGSVKVSSAGVAQTLPSHLDLRPPSDEFGQMKDSVAPAARMMSVGADRFTAMREQHLDGESSGDAGPLGSGAVQAHPLGFAQGMAERFHREGLPVARLWENHAALVSLGLNQKGKPGIWLVQKTH